MPGAENECTPPGDQFLQQLIVIFKVVFKVGILDQQDIPTRLRQPGPHRSAGMGEVAA